jgi:pimeloyl-ACP methyl ester carboxylesterase
MAISIQHDLPTDPPMVTKVGELYVGRQPQYLRGVANIKFAVEQMRNVQPNADYDDLTLVGHSAGADISMYFAKLYPARTKRVVTLDNLRVPFVTNGRFKILSFRSKDPIFKTDPGVIPPEDVRKQAGIDIIQTGFRLMTCAIPVPIRHENPSKLPSTILSKTKLLLSQSNQKRHNPT